MFKTQNYFETELKRRIELLNAFELNTNGFGYINIFSLSDQLTQCFNFAERLCFLLGFLKICSQIGQARVLQHIEIGCEIYQTIEISGNSQVYSIRGWIHDQDPAAGLNYVLEKYNLNEV